MFLHTSLSPHLTFLMSALSAPHRQEACLVPMFTDVVNDYDLLLCVVCRTSSAIWSMMGASWWCPIREITGKRYFFLWWYFYSSAGFVSWYWYTTKHGEMVSERFSEFLFISIHHRSVFSLGMLTLTWCMRSIIIQYSLGVRPSTTSLHVNQSAAATRVQHTEASLWWETTTRIYCELAL